MSSGRIDDDFLPSYNQLSFIVDYKRAQYIRRDNDKNYFDSDLFYQPLGCLDLEKVDKADCCDIELDCDILRTTVPVPTPLRLKQKLALKVYAIDAQTRFEIILPERSNFLEYSKYPSLTKRVYWMPDGYIYVPETLSIQAIKVFEILENPSAASTFACSGGSCYTDDSNYPCPADMIDLITKDILNTELKALVTIAPDETNNYQHDVQS